MPQLPLSPPGVVSQSLGRTFGSDADEELVDGDKEVDGTRVGAGLDHEHMEESISDACSHQHIQLLVHLYRHMYNQVQHVQSV